MKVMLLSAISIWPCPSSRHGDPLIDGEFEHVEWKGRVSRPAAKWVSPRALRPTLSPLICIKLGRCALRPRVGGEEQAFAGAHGGPGIGGELKAFTATGAAAALKT
ncbi:hypothetical protein OPU71_18015 [Niveibacterium sp. 24ML]|nr:hypothetical protein [Niveibacterium sp. 24ML]MCX9158024.1 hypothetical protein [Niveibacterium sp. 24ML]